MRLGAYPCNLQADSLASHAYGSVQISERHRHRYEFNRAYLSSFEEKGAKMTGSSPDGTLCEVMEIADHPWMLGVQFHPEFKSKPTDPHPLFVAFIKAAYEHSEARRQDG